MNSVFVKIIFTLATIMSLTSLSQADPLKLTKHDIIQHLKDDPSARKTDKTVPKTFNLMTAKTDLNLALKEIFANDLYRNDPIIREHLQRLSEQHPFTHVRAMALIVLSDYQDETFPLKFTWGQAPIGYEAMATYEINKSMHYCAPPAYARRPEFEYEAERKSEALKAEGKNYGRPAYRFKQKTRRGEISGGYYSIQGVGLFYKNNDAAEKTRIDGDNYRYIMPSETKDEYWLIDGPHHMIGGGTVFKLKETKDGLVRYLYRVLPSGVSEIYELAEGRVFISFVHSDPSKRGGMSKNGVFVPSPNHNYNPPIILYPDGKVSLACEKDAAKF